MGDGTRGARVTVGMEELTRAETGRRSASAPDNGRAPAGQESAGSLPPPPPPLEELPARLHLLHEHPAPTFAPDSRGGLRTPVKRLMNFFLRVVGRSQQTFNEQLLESVTLLMAEV